MKLRERIGLAALHAVDPERAHALALSALRMGLSPDAGAVQSDRLKVSLAGLELPHPVGLAAGFDKNATAAEALLKSGVAFVEVGGVTPRPQPGNPKPRLFRLTEDRAVINRFGFNNDGMDVVAERLAALPKTGVIGINLGANKDSDDKAKDFAKVLRRCGPHVDFATVNVSSPNTENLRDLQGAEALKALLGDVMDANEAMAKPVSIFLKVAPDLTADQVDEIVEVALSSGIHALLATNTTLSREGLKSPHQGETGGLSGAPLMEASTRILALFAQRIEGKIPLVGIGGISSPEDAYLKIKAGASALQLYSALVYRGMSLIGDITKGLDDMLTADGYAHLTDAVGCEAATYSA